MNGMTQNLPSLKGFQSEMGRMAYPALVWTTLLMLGMQAMAPAKPAREKKPCGAWRAQAHKVMPAKPFKRS